MRITRRLIAISIVLTAAFFVYDRWRPEPTTISIEDFESGLKSYYDPETGPVSVPIQHRGYFARSSANCRMDNCFNYTKCRRKFAVYLYPPMRFPDDENADEDGAGAAPAVPEDNTNTATTKHYLYKKLLKVLNESNYLTRNPLEACLFVLSIDTLDRDHLSTNYVPQIDRRIAQLPYWNRGENHVIFNLYSGTWPDYEEHDLKLNYEKAILARASMSLQKYRNGFDISIPLFHNHHPDRVLKATGQLKLDQYPINSTYLFSFKGKRYVHGLGSKTRNALYHLSNANDSIVLTTCRHGKNWKETSDDRCNDDNAAYGRHDYERLMRDSKFCLVPRGRRLGSFRFLEALKAGCIPVVISNAWMLPFGEVIDWTEAVIWADERRLFQIDHVLRSVPDERIFRMKQQTQFLWDRYFASIEKIIQTTFEIVRDRLPNKKFVRTKTQWNRYPGALFTPLGYSNRLEDYPFYYPQAKRTKTATFTAIVSVKSNQKSNLYKFLRKLITNRYLVAIVILWPFSSTRPNWKTLLNSQKPIELVDWNASAATAAAPNGKLTDFRTLLRGQAILQIEDTELAGADELEFGFRVWRENPQRIVGYAARSHYRHPNETRWLYASQPLNHYSVVLLNFAFYHRFYHFLYETWLRPRLRSTRHQPCPDLALNFLVSHVTGKGPMKLLDGHWPANEPSDSREQQTCLQDLIDTFGYLPLTQTFVRYDPVFYRDDVSSLRKKYRQLEAIKRPTKT